MVIMRNRTYDTRKTFARNISLRYRSLQPERNKERAISVKVIVACDRSVQSLTIVFRGEFSVLIQKIELLANKKQYLFT